MHDELTAKDIEKMQEELDYRRIELRPQLIEEVKRAREYGDLSENFEYKEAKRAKNRNDSRIRYLQAMIKTAVVIDSKSEEGVVGLYDKVTVYIPEDDAEESYQIVTGVRYDVSSGFVSKESPSARRFWASAWAKPPPLRSTKITAMTLSYALLRKWTTTIPRRWQAIEN